MKSISLTKALVLSLFLVFTASHLATYKGFNLVTQANAAVVSNIDVRGNQRIDDEIVASYLTIQPGQRFSNLDIDDSIKALFATGLFNDVSIFQQGNTLVVDVDENSTVNKVFFEGNNRVKDDALESIVRIRSQGIYSDEQAAADVDAIELAYSRTGRRGAQVSYEVIPLANNRVNVIYRVNEGDKTKIAAVIFEGNDTFSDARLSDVISTKRSTFLSFLSSNDVFDRNRINADEERLREFYFNKGFADFQILGTDATLDEVANEYTIVISVDEGPRYTFGSILIESTIPGVNADDLYSSVETFEGENYSAKDVEDSLLEITKRVAEAGFAFVEVAPRGNRNFDTNTIDVTYLVDEGARIFIEDIRIIGNDRTRDYVIRREFDLSEGDAYNRVLINKTRDRIEGLGFFESVAISTSPGSEPDKIVVNVNIVEKSTGDVSLSGGFSSNGGASANVSFTERNFLGRGQFLSVSARSGEDEESYTFTFREPYFLGYRVSAGLSLQTTTSDDTDERRYSVDTDGATFTFGVPITEKLSSSVFYTYSGTDIAASNRILDPNASGVGGTNTNNNGTQGDIAGELSSALVGSLGSFASSGVGYSLLYSDLDNADSPREGIRATFSQTFYGVGGDASYFSTEASIISYYTLSEEQDLVLFGRARGGHVELIGSDDGTGFRTIDNFQANANTIRGFDAFGYGPRDPITNDPLGGRTYWNATAEVQFPFPFISRSLGLRAALFADVGQLSDVGQPAISAFTLANPTGDVSRLNDDDIRASIGASLLWNSPFGPLRVDYAVPIEDQPFDDLREFNFGISRDF